MDPTPVFRPAGDLVSRLFGRRVQQLALPTRPLDVAHGMDSRVVAILGPSGEQRAAAWMRTLRSTGEYVYSGCYSSRTLPGSRQPSVHVAFPLEAGNVQVFLRPGVSSDGMLTLTSPAGAFGEDGAYVVVHDRGGFHAARAPIHETFRLYVDDEGVLRTDHVLRLWAAPVVRLHYRLTPAEPWRHPAEVQASEQPPRSFDVPSRPVQDAARLTADRTSRRAHDAPPGP